MSEKTKSIKSASPKVRKFARELGANINQIKGSQRAGRISEEDVKSFIKSSLSEKTTDKKNEIKNQYNHTEFGEVDIQPIPRLKKIARTHLTKSWNEIPHVTQHDEADITEMEEFRSSLRDIHTGEKIKTTPRNSSDCVNNYTDAKKKHKVRCFFGAPQRSHASFLV